eukprot:GILI01029211.1.p1 GENE.GILI01029211.1~~GILI01029211.1.p1  ORF type:complete len:225 (+),score=50.72 GILI01029211.1:83-757(+)
MVRRTYIARATDGFILVETMDDRDPALQQYKQVVKQLLKKLSRGPAKCSVDSGPFVFHYIIEDGVIYMTLCDKSYPKRLAFQFLDEIYKGFLEELKREYGTGSVNYRSQIETIERPYAFIKFDRFISTKKQDYKDPRSNKALAKLNEDLQEVQNIMRQNIDEILSRGENLDVIGSKATSLRAETKVFDTQAKYLNLQSLWEKYGPCTVVFFVVMLVLFLRLKYL